MGVYDREKFKALVHYICWSVPDPKKLGAIKLNKILWATDFSHFYTTGESLTGERYLKRQFGPVPGGILQALRELELEGALSITEAPHFQYTQRQFTALKKPNTQFFTSAELAETDEMIKLITEAYTAKSVSQASHDHIWSAALDGEEIPHFSIFAVPGEITSDEIEWARTELESLGA
jgi:hypothetical protein